jgi:hypothetical protein
MHYLEDTPPEKLDVSNAVNKRQVGSDQSFNETSPRLFAVQLEVYHQETRLRR